MQPRFRLSQQNNPLERDQTRFIAFLMAAIFLVAALFLLRSPSPTVLGQGEWWDLNWRYRFSVTVDGAGYGRADKIAELTVNFTDLLNSQGDSGKFELNSVRVIEVDGSENIIDTAVPFQFDRATNYNANNNAVGTLVWMLTGETAADEQRHYQVYFDVQGTNFPDPDIPKYIALRDNQTDPNGVLSYEILSEDVNYWYHKAGGGFASVIDKDDHDWVSWNPATGAAGDFRGIPNLVHPSNGGYFHPGRTSVGSGVPNKGPLKITIRSTSFDQTWRTIWEIFPTYARLTVQLAPVAYWFQYEGTPGGVLEPASDFIVRSTGEQTLANVNWAADITGEEWMFATDPTVGRSLYMIHYHDADTTTDYYANSNSLMTILAFGRNGSERFLTQVPQQFAFGLVDATALDDVRPTVHDIAKPLGFSISPAEKRPFDPSPTPTATAEASSTPTATASASPTTTVTPTATATATEISTSSPTSVNSPTPTEMVTASPTITLAATMSSSPSPTGTFVATASATPTGSATAVASPTPTGEATPTPLELIFLPLALNMEE